MNKHYRLPIALSLVIHLVVAGVLLFGNFTSTPKPKPMPTVVLNQPVQAVAISKQVVEQHKEKIRKEKAAVKAAEQKRLKEIQDRARRAKEQKAKEAQRKKNLEIQRKKKAKEKQQAEERAKVARSKAQAAEKARKQKELERQKAAADAKAKRLKKEADEKKAKALKKKEDERKRKEKEARERAEQDRLLAQQMEQEMASRQQARQQQMVSEISRFTALITQTIQRYLIRDKATMEGKSCKLTITLAPSGFVISVKAGQGDPVVCSAATNAVRKAQTLPVSKDPEVYSKMRTISLMVVPEF